MCFLNKLVLGNWSARRCRGLLMTLTNLESLNLQNLQRQNGTFKTTHCITANAHINYQTLKFLPILGVFG